MFELDVPRAIVLAAEAGGAFDAFLAQAAALLLAAAGVGYVCSRLGIVPIVGFLVAGVLIGPNALGLVRDLEVVEIVAEVGIVLLLFTIGIEFSLERLARIRRYVVLGGGVKVALALLLAIGVLLPFGVGIRDAVFTGFLVAISSTAIVLKVLAGRGELNAPTGTVAMALLIFEDLAAVLMVLLVPILAGIGGPEEIARVGVTTVVIIVAVLVGARRVLPRVLEVVARACSPEVFLLTILAICIGTAWLTYLAGVSVSLGAFLAGLLVSESRQASHALGEVLPLQILFTAAFFLSIGMLLDVRFLAERPLLVLGAVVLGFVLPLVTTLASTSVLRVGVPTVLASSFLLAQVSEFAFVIERAGAAVGLSPAGLGDDGSQAFIAAVVLLMVLTPVSAAFGRWLAGLAVARAGAAGRSDIEVAGSTPVPGAGGGEPGGVLLSGWGPRARHLAADLSGLGVPVRVVTLNPGGATEAEDAGYAVTLGASTKQHVLEHAGIARAAVLVIGDDELEDARRIAAIATELAPALPIVVVAATPMADGRSPGADGAHRSDLAELAAAGVGHVVDPERAGLDALTLVARSYVTASGDDTSGPDVTRLVDVGVRSDDSCTHAVDTAPVQPSASGCEACLRTSRSWVHLRVCLSCGHVGCCDSSPGRHARAHASAHGHQLVASIEPGEAWAYCFEDDVMLRTTRPAAPGRGA